MNLFIDLETASPVNIKTAGAYRYLEEAEIIMAAWAVDDGPVELWDCRRSPSPPAALTEALTNPDVRIVAHNATFERVALRTCWRLDIPPERYLCTSVMASAAGLPSSLGLVAPLLGSNKIEEGKALIKRFCGSNAAGYIEKAEAAPDDAGLFGRYCQQDVEACRHVWKVLTGVLPAGTRRWIDAIYPVDQRINDRGVKIDLESVGRLTRLAGGGKQDANEEVNAISDGAVGAVTQVQAMQTWVQERGVDVPDMTADTVRQALDGAYGELPADVRRVLELRQETGRSSTAKYGRMSGAACRDGRMRGLFQLYGAERTGRWAGRLVQPQNLTRPKQGRDEIDYGLLLLEHGAEDLLDVPPVQMAADSLRAMFVPASGRMSVGDWSAIEGRMLALLAGETDKIQMYEEYDAGRGPDAYEHAYHEVFGIPAADVTASQRKIGKVIDLAFGYAGGVGGEVKFCATYGVDVKTMAETAARSLSPEVMERSEGQFPWFKARKMHSGLEPEVWIPLNAVKIVYRERNAAIAQLWRDCEDAFRHVRNVPGSEVTVGAVSAGRLNKPVRFYSQRVAGRIWVFIELPSGRCLTYPDVVEKEVKRRVEDENGVEYDLVKELQFFGRDSGQAGQWGRRSTHGGVLVENITQAACLDLLAEALQRADRAGLEIIMHCHDEMVEDGGSPRLKEIMEHPADWAPWPSLTKAVVHTGLRYGKF